MGHWPWLAGIWPTRLVSVRKRPLFQFATNRVASGPASPIDPLGVFCGRGLFGRGSGRSLVSEASGVGTFRQACRLLTSVTLAFALGGLAIRSVLSQQQLAQGLEVAAQDAEGHVTFVATFATIATTLQAVASWQRADR